MPGTRRSTSRTTGTATANGHTSGIGHASADPGGMPGPGVRRSHGVAPTPRTAGIVEPRARSRASNPSPPVATTRSPASRRRSPSTRPPDRAPITARLLEIVRDRTGYPIETLGLDLDIEADLGIDSIKRVEILGKLRDEFPR